MKSRCLASTNVQVAVETSCSSLVSVVFLTSSRGSFIASSCVGNWKALFVVCVFLMGVAVGGMADFLTFPFRARLSRSHFF